MDLALSKAQSTGQFNSGMPGQPLVEVKKSLLWVLPYVNRTVACKHPSLICSFFDRKFKTTMSHISYKTVVFVKNNNVTTIHHSSPDINS